MSLNDEVKNVSTVVNSEVSSTESLVLNAAQIKTTNSNESTEKGNSRFFVGIIVPIILVLLLFSLAINIALFARFRSINLPAASSVSENQTTKEEVLDIIQQRGLDSLPSADKVYQFEIKGLVGSLNDPYSEFLPAADAQDFRNSLNERYQGIGVRFQFDRGQVVVTQAIKDGPADKAGVKTGDVIYKVEDTLVSDLSDTQIGENIRGEKGTTVKLIFLRGGKEIPFTIERDEIQTPLIELEFKGTQAIIAISSFGENLDSKMNEIATEIKQKRDVSEIVLDLRGNTGGILSETVEIASYFMPERTLIVYEETKKGRENVYSTAKSVSLQQYPVTVLVDDSSASASEILAGSLRTERKARLVGQPTFGKGVVQQIFNLKNGDQLKLTIAKWFLSDGSEIDKKGLQPDVLLRTSEDALNWAISNKQ